MKIYTVVFSFVCFCFGLLVQAQPKAIAFSELEVAMRTNPKPVVIFLHTLWCSYCALMEKKTFANTEVINKLNNKYYFVSFDAEYKEDITFFNRVFSFKKTGIKGGVHSLASTLSGQQAYPTLIFLNSKLEKVYEHNAYIRPKELTKLLEAL
ncbi:MAG: thioredoxin family protein [Flavobacteriaceae bacterium]|jgi:thioredoxin-related protein|nr:thioredoxin family protein [Flavobacteriaceae bacterium]